MPAALGRDALQVVHPLHSCLIALAWRARHDELAGDGGLAAGGVALERDSNVVDLLGPHELHGANGEGGVLHREGEGDSLEEDVLEGDEDVIACADEEGALGLGGQRLSEERDDILAAYERGQLQEALGLPQAAGLEVYLHADLRASLGPRGCNDDLFHVEVRAVGLKGNKSLEGGSPQAHWRGAPATLLLDTERGGCGVETASCSSHLLSGTRAAISGLKDIKLDWAGGPGHLILFFPAHGMLCPCSLTGVTHINTLHCHISLSGSVTGIC